MERGGQVHVAVRTPDARLAGELREDLPALTTKLEQAGFRAEAWHPATAGERGAPGARMAEPQAGTPGQDTPNQPGQDRREQPRDPQQRRPKDPEDPSQIKQAQKDFAWL
jgi:hypothetical protein